MEKTVNKTHDDNSDSSCDAAAATDDDYNDHFANSGD